MNTTIELYHIYAKDLAELREQYQQEKDYLYSAMKEFVMIYEKESYLKQKLEVLERQIMDQSSQENADDR